MLLQSIYSADFAVMCEAVTRIRIQSFQNKLDSTGTNFYIVFQLEDC